MSSGYYNNKINDSLYGSGSSGSDIFIEDKKRNGLGIVEIIFAIILSIILLILVSFSCFILYTICQDTIIEKRQIIQQNNRNNDDNISWFSYSSYDNRITTIFKKKNNTSYLEKILEFFSTYINPIESIENKCAICLEDIDFVSKNDPPFILQCNHVFHKRCISEYALFNAMNGSDVNCPLCRIDIQIV